MSVMRLLMVGLIISFTYPCQAYKHEVWVVPYTTENGGIVMLLENDVAGKGVKAFYEVWNDAPEALGLRMHDRYTHKAAHMFNERTAYSFARRMAHMNLCTMFESLRLADKGAWEDADFFDRRILMELVLIDYITYVRDRIIGKVFFLKLPTNAQYLVRHSHQQEHTFAWVSLDEVIQITKSVRQKKGDVEKISIYDVHRKAFSVDPTFASILWRCHTDMKKVLSEVKSSILM